MDKQTDGTLRMHGLLSFEGREAMFESFDIGFCSTYHGCHTQLF